MSQSAFEALCLILDTLADVPGGEAVLELLEEGREQEAEALMIRLSEAEAK